MQQTESTMLDRRRFLAGTAAATVAACASMRDIEMLASPAFSAELKKRGKRVIVLWLAGGASQLETWDPKPGRPTGGPYSAIPTNATGVHISELLPLQAQRMQHTAIIRSLNTKNGDHGGGHELMMHGRRNDPGFAYPDLGAMLARELGQADSKVPDYVSMYTATEGRRNGSSGFLGSRYAPMFLTNDLKPKNLKRLDTITDLDHKERMELRGFLAKRFEQGRNGNTLGSHNYAYQRVRGLMASEELFDVSKEPEAMRLKYGPTQFGEQCLVARRLIEAGVPFVRVARAWWDSHGQNFETHRELCADLDHCMAALVDDLHERGLLENTLIVTMGEFGRTPKINASLGRDHFARAWSCALTGLGIKGGAVHGKTDDDGNTVADGEMNAADLFATIFTALGIDPHKEYHAGSRPVPIADFGATPATDVLA